MIDSNINFQYVQEVCIMSNQYKNTTEVKVQEKKIPLSSKVNLTQKQLHKIGEDTLNGYATITPNEYLGKFLDL
ncbi:hypothetical protein [Acinetobacter sp. H1(2024)]|jgi:hypothetical protein|uniref:hypothetical protein n=1 Tax=Acinetobacter sp. H1(2024) TaxID=3390190 RepID=UPI0039784BD5